MTVNPYRGLPSTSFWSTGVALAAPGSMDPMTAAKFTIAAGDRVATMGSCFAQHISRYISRIGLQYFVTEAASDLQKDEAERRNFGVFSARYGNVYTARQARQLFDRAFGTFQPTDTTWTRNNRFVDPLRPQIEPNGFASVEDMETSRQVHLAAVRRLFVETDVLVFTLGLTEAFESIHDGTVYPVAPGVSGGSFSAADHRFVNFTVSEVIDDLESFIQSARTKNPRMRILLTVSPVPLIATYESRHVLVSNTISKATLRVAAAHVASQKDYVDYFPSYEIIAGSADGAGYFEADLRQIEQRGVDHVMRVFRRHLIDGAGPASPTAETPLSEQMTAAHLASTAAIVCDEELIETSLRSAGL